MDVLARYEPIVDDYEAFRRACERPLPSVVRVNTLKASVGRVVTALQAEGIGVEQLDWADGLLELDTDSPGSTWPYVHGWIHGQEAVSAVPARALDPAPGERILDACAAPGSKATQLAARMEDRGTLVANDANLGRLSSLRANADRLGVTCAVVTNRDARTIEPLDGELFERALADVPCSCEGTIRKNPDALDDWSEAYLAEISETQREILQRAVEVTRPGGTVVYATCTFAPEENEAVLGHVLETADCRAVDFSLPIDTRPGVTEWQGESYDPQVRHAKRIYPHFSDTGGFFCAKLEVTG